MRAEGRKDKGFEVANRAFRLVVAFKDFDGRVQRATPAISQYHTERDTKLRDPEFERAYDRLVQRLSRRVCEEQITQSAIKTISGAVS